MSDIKDTIKFEIIEKIAVLEEYGSGWSKELNLVSWNGQEPKYDIRDWRDNYSQMTRGIILTTEIFYKLLEAANKIEGIKYQGELKAKNDDIGLEIVKNIAVLEKYESGWSKELNLVSLNGQAAKYDIRDWSPSHLHMSRGVHFTDEAFGKLIKVGNKLKESEQPKFKCVNNAHIDIKESNKDIKQSLNKDMY